MFGAEPFKGCLEDTKEGWDNGSWSWPRKIPPIISLLTQPCSCISCSIRLSLLKVSVITITHRQRTVCSQDASPLPCVRRRALGDRGHSVRGSSSSSPSEAYIMWEWMRRYLPQLRLWSKGECHRNALSLIFASDLTSAHYGFSLNNTLSMKERSTCNFSPSSQSWLWRKDSGNCALWTTLRAAEH